MPFINRKEMQDPFMKIRVGPPGAKPNDMTLLSPQIQGLVDTFEFTETIDGGKGSASQIRLIFREFDNRPGSVLDLTFDGQKGTKFVTPAEIGLSKQRRRQIEQADFDATKDSSTSASETDDTKRAEKDRELDLKDKQIDAALKFIIQERNTIEVTWGYRTQGTTQKLQPRTVRGEILQILHRAPASDIATTEVIAVDISSGELAKVYPEKGLNFNRGTVKKLLNGRPLLDKTDRKDEDPARIDDIIRAVAAGGILPNADVRIDLTQDELELDLNDASAGRNWPQGMNLHTFLKEQAEKLHVHYFVTVSRRQGKAITVLNMVSRKTHEGRNKFHFAWKSGLGKAGIESAGESTLVFNTVLGYNLALYPSGGSGASSHGVCTKEKKKTGHAATSTVRFGQALGEQPKEIQVQSAAKMQALDDVDPAVAGNSVAKAVGVSTYSAGCDRRDHIREAERLAGRMDRGLKLDFETIGIPQLTPSVVKFSNIGLRYSGLYYLLSVTHTITADGYTNRCTGESNVVASGGTSVRGKPPVKGELPETVEKKFRADPGSKPGNL